MPILAVLFVTFWSLKYVVYRNNRNKNYWYNIDFIDFLYK